jgi:hypothetical protein
LEKTEDKKMPVFMKIEEYRELLDVMELIKRKLIEAKNAVESIEELKLKEEAEIKRWNAILIGIEARVAELDKILLEPREV